jgi:RND family efflux transporter MFP subunit
MKRKNIVLVLIIAVLVGLIVWRLAGNKRIINQNKQAASKVSTAIPVTIDTVALTAFSQSLIKTGTLLPWQEADITAAASGIARSVSFNLGSQVSKGSVVARIDDQNLQLRLGAAQLQQQKFAADYKRYQILLAGDATTESNVQQIKLDLDNANNQVAQIRRQIADNNVKAPISGQVVAKNTESGEFVNPGNILGKIVDNTALRVEIQVAETEAYQLRMGQKLKVATDLYPNQAFEGTIIFISQLADAAHNYQVQLRLPNPAATPLKAGTFVTVDFSRQSESDGIQIPRSALATMTGATAVYVAEAGKAVLREVTLGRDLGNSVEVLAGLKPGELVITSGQINLKNGSAVSIAR